MTLRTTSRTVVTELKAFIVDNVSRSGALRQAVSAKVPETSSLTEKDFNVDSSTSVSFPESSAFVGLLTQEPVLIKLEQLGDPDTEEPEPDPQVYTTGTIFAPSSHIAGQPLSITVTDSDVPVIISNIMVVLYNEYTGETEQLTLQRTANTTFTGTMSTIFSPSKGTDFDSSLNIGHGHNIRVAYPDAHDASGNPMTINAIVAGESPYVDTVLTVNEYIHVGKKVAIMVNDRDIAGEGTTFCVLRNNNTGELETITLTETASGIFTASVQTQSASLGILSEDGIMGVAVGHILEVEFTEPQALSQQTKTAQIEVRTTQTVDGLITVPTQVSLNGTMSITVMDYDLASVAYVDVAVSNIRTGEFEYVRCTEAVNGSGVLSGTLQLTTAGSNNTDGVMSVQLGDTLRAVYVDGVDGDGMGPVLINAESTVIADPTPPSTPSDPDPDPDPEPDPDPDTDPEPSEPDPLKTVELVVNGLFLLNGAFNGKLTVTGLRETKTRCTILHV